MRKKLLLLAAVLVPLVCVTFSAVPGFADSISDTLTVFSPNGSIFAQISALESQEGNGDQIFLIGSASLGSMAQIGNPLVLCESGPCDSSTPNSQLSDMVGIVQATIGGKNFFFLGFVSDGPNGLAPGIGAAFGGVGNRFQLEQPSVPVDVSVFLDPGLFAQGYRATFVSDGEVPEPGTMMLLGSGLIGLAGVVRRRNNR